MDFIEEELVKMGVRAISVELIRDKDGVTVARVRPAAPGAAMVIKAFARPEFRREIGNYAALTALGVPTLKLYASTDRALLMEDILESPYRLGVAEDLGDARTAALVARWYRELHSRGHEYAAEHGAELYDENDALTPENLERVKERTGTASLPVWRLIEDNWEKRSSAVDGARRTLTYNDFYYTNLAVARSGESALMFDYNLLGRGYAYADLRNVCSSLSGAAQEAFLGEYGPFDEREAEIDAVVSVLNGLISACGRERLPAWSAGLIEELRGGLYERVERLMGK